MNSENIEQHHDNSAIAIYGVPYYLDIKKFIVPDDINQSTFYGKDNALINEKILPLVDIVKNYEDLSTEEYIGRVVMLLPYYEGRGSTF